MEAQPVRGRVADPSASAFGDSVFRSQVALVGAVGLVVCITVSLADRDLGDSPAFFVGITGVLWITIAAAIVPWLRLDRRLQMAVPLLDVVALAMLRMAVPESGFGILMVFPVIWLATSFGRLGGVAGAMLAAMLLLVQTALVELDIATFAPTSSSPIAAATLAVALVFVAAVMSTNARRLDSQRVLLRRQTRMLESALTRARVQETTLREAFDAVDFAVLSLDIEGGTLTRNRATRALLAAIDLPENTPWHRFPLYQSDKVTPVAPEDFPHVRVMSGETVHSDIYWLGHRTGPRFTISVTARPLRDQQVGLDRVVVVLRDVSAEVRAITDRDDLVTSMSHELRTPLSSILGYVDLALESPDLPAPTRDMLGIALTNAERLNALVSDLLAARSTSAATSISLTIAPTDVSALVRESIDAIRPMASERLLAVLPDVADGVIADVDGFRLRQVVDNLLSNAIKYNRTGGRVTVSVELLTCGSVSEVDIRVGDTGRGMSLDEQKGLFERFYRAESVRNSTVHGTGLGLSISREIVVLHGGTIEVDSEPGRGTQVTVTVPQHASPSSPPPGDAPASTPVPVTTPTSVSDADTSLEEH